MINSPKTKIFNIVAEFKLTSKPNWLDDFRKKYDKPYNYHTTLKTCTYFNENEFEELKITLKKILKSYSPHEISFNKVIIRQTSKGGCIMIKSDKNKELVKLQKEISEKFSKYGKHISKKHKKFEINFNPHITIARHLNQEQLIDAKNELKEDIHCKAKIKQLVLTTAKQDSFEEWSNLNNKTYFSLNRE